MCRLSPAQFDRKVEAGVLPKPIRDLGRPLWRRATLEDAILRLDTYIPLDSDEEFGKVGANAMTTDTKARKPRKAGLSGYPYVRKERSSAGTEFYRFRWRPQAWKGKVVEYVFTEQYGAPEFKLQHSILKTELRR